MIEKKYGPRSPTFAPVAAPLVYLLELAAFLIGERQRLGFAGHGEAFGRWGGKYTRISRRTYPEALTIVADLAETVPGSRLVYMSDREGDIRALMDTAAERGYPADFLIRSKHNRKISLGDQLWDRVSRGKPEGELEFTMPAAPDRPARLVRQTCTGSRSPCPCAKAHRS